MRSSCPHCLSLTEHNHEDTQITCNSCGKVFSPFLTELDASSLPDFSESRSAFQEIVDFGEKLGKTDLAELTSTKSKLAQSAPPPPAPSVDSVSRPSVSASPQEPSSLLLTTLSHLSHYPPFRCLPPVSLMVIMGDDASPLENGFKTLSQLATDSQADGIVGIRCSISPDNRRALLIGTPIQWEK